MSTWIEIRLAVPETEPTALAPLDAVCLALSPGGFVTEGADAPPGDEPPPEAGWLRYRIYVGEAEADAAVGALSATLAAYPGATISAIPLDPDWRQRWKRWFLPFEVGEDLLVTPPWHDPEAKAGQRRLVIEPGMAFGTGQHDTTKLCLQGVQAAYASGEGPREVLDVGCGTGILAVAAALYGAHRVVGVDIDPQAIRAAQQNAERNGVTDRIESFSTRPVGQVPGRFQLVCANIMAHILIDMASPLADRVAPGGRLMLSGVLREQAGEVAEAYEARGLVHDDTVYGGGWVRLDFSRPEPA